MRMKFRSLILPCAFKTASSSSAKSFMSFSRKISIKRTEEREVLESASDNGSRLSLFARGHNLPAN